MPGEPITCRQDETAPGGCVCVSQSSFEDCHGNTRTHIHTHTHAELDFGSGEREQESVCVCVFHGDLVANTTALAMLQFRLLALCATSFFRFLVGRSPNSADDFVFKYVHFCCYICLVGDDSRRTEHGDGRGDRARRARLPHGGRGGAVRRRLQGEAPLGWTRKCL